MPWRAGNLVGGKYRLERPLARGGMGSLWAATHLGLDVQVAIKFMDEATEKAEDRRVRFAREAKAAASLKSPNVVQVMDFDATGEHPYIVMEMLEGEDLGRRIETRGRLGIGEIARVVEAIAEGLEAAHSAGIVHRDLKPSNVFLARSGDRELVKILDFGVAKTTRLDGADHQTTTAGVVVGSPSYMSPEQARGGRVDERSDLWSLGVLVFHAVTGRRPFEGRNLGDILVKICTDSVPRASDVLPGLPPRLDGFFERALCRSPDGRFASARELAAGLAEVARECDDVPISSRSMVTDARPRDEATASLVAASVSAESSVTVTRVEPRSPAVVALSSTVDPSGRTNAPARRGALVWVLGAAAVVVAGWVATRGSFFGGPEASPSPGAATASPADSAAETSLAPRDVAITVSPAAAQVETASPGGPPPAASTAVTTAPTARRPPIIRPRATATGAVDPKFGLRPEGHAP